VAIPADWEGEQPERRAQWEAAAQAATAPLRELLRQAAEALMDSAKAALTVKPSLDQPYPDDPRWTPYTRWVERPARRAHDLSIAIRKNLRESE